MLLSAESEKFLLEGIIFFMYILICGGLIKRRFSKTASLLTAGATAVGIILLQIVLLLEGQDATLVLTLLPLTAYLPAIVCLHILSKSNFFQTMAIWLVGVIACFILSEGSVNPSTVPPALNTTEVIFVGSSPRQVSITASRALSVRFSSNLNENSIVRESVT